MANGVAIQLSGEYDVDLASAATFVEVHEKVGEPTRFRFQLAVTIEDEDLPALLDARLGPGAEVAVVVPVDGENHFLAKGLVHQQNILLRHSDTGSTLDVVGSDSSILMDRELRAQVWPDVSASEAVESIVEQYGLTADVETSPDRYLESKHALVQRDTDLRFIRQLARRYGYLFWLSADEEGVETAHFRRPPLDGDPAVTLRMNRPEPTIGSLNLGWDVERATSAVCQQLDLTDKSDIEADVPVSPLPPLGTDGLGAIHPAPSTLQVIGPSDSAADLRTRGEAALIESGWFVRASTETSLTALGNVARAHTVAAVEGAGSRHSGRYFIHEVRHLIDDTSHIMELQMVRNGWGV
ncbi:MAG: hypothetical protein AAGF12_16555 [Myxococcota bacterium]